MPLTLGTQREIIHNIENFKQFFQIISVDYVDH